MDQCPACRDTGHVCEDHPDRPWGGFVDRLAACPCGAPGMPCPACCDPVLKDGRQSIHDAFTPRHLGQRI